MNTNLINYLLPEEIKALEYCQLCPRKCKINRLKGQKGFCNCDIDFNIALIINHKGEEPVLSKDKGICNVFFSHCNCQCIFCQNYQISNNQAIAKNSYQTMDQVVNKIIETLSQSENILGFVSPTHQIPIMNAIIRQIHSKGIFPTIVYNCGGYENEDILDLLNHNIDVYLPDFKYSDNKLGDLYSKAPQYKDFAIKSLKKMYYFKGSSLLFDSNNTIESGLIVRHLLLPNHLEQSKKALDLLAWELSPNITLSLMSQYVPPFKTKYDSLNRKVTIQEYEELKEFAYSLGFHKGYFQDLSSQESTIPDFENNTFINNGL